MCILGATLALPTEAEVQIASNLHQAARLAAANGAWDSITPADVRRPRLHAGQRQVRGLFCGGTLAEEAELALAGCDHEVTDFGDDRYTRGRAHPMIDPSLRNQAILEVGNDPRVAVLLLDVILGHGAHPDPAAAAVPAVRAAIERAAADGRELTVMAHVVGTDLDAQGLARQEDVLRAAGVHVFGSNHHAAVAAALVVE
jgi:FdrA protein